MRGPATLRPGEEEQVAAATERGSGPPGTKSRGGRASDAARELASGDPRRGGASQRVTQRRCGQVVAKPRAVDGDVTEVGAFMTERRNSCRTLSLGCRGALPLVDAVHSTIRVAVSSVCPAGGALPGSCPVLGQDPGAPGAPRGAPRHAPGAHFLGYLITLPFGTKLFFRFFAILDKTGTKLSGTKLSVPAKYFGFLPKRAKSGILGPPGPLIPGPSTDKIPFFRVFSEIGQKWPFWGFPCPPSCFRQNCQNRDFGAPGGGPRGGVFFSPPGGSPSPPAPGNLSFLRVKVRFSASNPGIWRFSGPKPSFQHVCPRFATDAQMNLELI